MSTPIQDNEITSLAHASNLHIPTDYYEGVRSNLSLLRTYSQLIEDFPLPDTLPAAFDYTP